MSSTFKATTGLNRAGLKAAKVPSCQRGSVIARSKLCDEAPSWKKQQAVAAVLTSAIVAVASASPAFAEDAIEATVATVPVEVEAVSPVFTDGEDVAYCVECMLALLECMSSPRR
jgi:hypothetical protein